jgi:cell division protein FtsB
MADFKKQPQNSFWHSPILLGVLFCIVVVFAYNIVGLAIKERETAKKKALMLDQIDTLHKREQVLSSDIARLKTTEGVEDTIRDKYQVAKPGEKMVIIVDDKALQSNPDTTSSEHSFWGYIKKFFGK